MNPNSTASTQRSSTWALRRGTLRRFSASRIERRIGVSFGNLAALGNRTTSGTTTRGTTAPDSTPGLAVRIQFPGGSIFSFERATYQHRAGFLEARRPETGRPETRRPETRRPETSLSRYYPRASRTKCRPGSFTRRGSSSARHFAFAVAKPRYRRPKTEVERGAVQKG
jgi:hypothetical protein